MHGVTDCVSSAAKKNCGTEPELIMHNMMNAPLRQTYTLVPGCSAPNLNTIGTTSTITTYTSRGSRTTTPTSDSSTTKYSYVLYVASIIACIAVLAV